MKVSEAQKAKNREAILATAARLLRTKGPEGIGVAEVMDGEGLTHGGFYGYFLSREQLATEAMAEAMAPTADYADSAISSEGFGPLLCGYLSERHLDEVEAGCPIAATVSEIARQPQPVRAAFGDGMKTYFEVVAAGQDRNTAIARVAAKIGALALARAVASEDRALAEEILEVVRSEAGAA